MTIGYGKNGEKGLITIKESGDHYQPNICFCIPFPKLDHVKLRSSSSFFKLPYKVGSMISNNGESEEIWMKRDKEREELIATVKTSKVIFKISNDLNFEKNRIKRIWIPLKNKYVGDDRTYKYRNHRFLILTIMNIQALDELFFENRIFFIN